MLDRNGEKKMTMNPHESVIHHNQIVSTSEVLKQTATD